MVISTSSCHSKSAACPFELLRLKITSEKGDPKKPPPPACWWNEFLRLPCPTCQPRLVAPWWCQFRAAKHRISILMDILSRTCKASSLSLSPWSRDFCKILQVPGWWWSTIEVASERECETFSFQELTLVCKQANKEVSKVCTQCTPVIWCNLRIF